MAQNKYFLDANILLAGLLWPTKERKLLELGEKKALRLVSSLYVLREVEDVLSRMKLEQSKITEALLYLQSIMEIIHVPNTTVEKYWDEAPHKKDAPVLAAAKRAGAILVTRDKKLRQKAKKHLVTNTAKEILEG